jgi:hypothetical protein
MDKNGGIDSGKGENHPRNDLVGALRKNFVQSPGSLPRLVNKNIVLIKSIRHDSNTLTTHENPG